MINTPIKEESPETEEVLTPMANLKMLIRVASETNPGLPPPKRELFREDSIGEDHDYGCFTTNVPGTRQVRLWDRLKCRENRNRWDYFVRNSCRDSPNLSRRGKSVKSLSTIWPNKWLPRGDEFMTL